MGGTETKLRITLVPGGFAMAGKGRRYTFHGAFSTEVAADRKAKQRGGFVRRVQIGVKGKKKSTRWVVMVDRDPFRV